MQLIAEGYNEKPLPVTKVLESLEQIVRDIKEGRVDVHRLYMEVELDHLGKSQVELSLTLLTKVEHL